jgi:hypothetical protein
VLIVVWSGDEKNMSCKDCEKACAEAVCVYPFRIGNPKIGFGTIEVQACQAHAKLIQAIFRGEAFRDNEGNWAVKKC